MAQVEIDPDQDSDPIKASYDVFIKPHIAADRQIYILQFPNRDSKQHYTARNQSQPLKMRIKPSAGMVELDVPLDAWRNYDRRVVGAMDYLVDLVLAAHSQVGEDVQGYPRMSSLTRRNCLKIIP
jgi:hypothetical protein